MYSDLNIKVFIYFQISTKFKGFDEKVETNRLSINDADYVDAIHTSSALGYNKPIGHANFFVNNGGFQPGCYSLRPKNYQPKISINLCKREIDFDLIKDETSDGLVLVMILTI